MQPRSSFAGEPMNEELVAYVLLGVAVLAVIWLAFFSPLR
jgi:hypothetical protein